MLCNIDEYMEQCSSGHEDDISSSADSISTLSGDNSNDEYDHRSAPDMYDTDDVQTPPYSPISTTSDHSDIIMDCNVQSRQPLQENLIQNQVESSCVNHWNGFKVVGDNLDKDIKPRYMRIGHQTKSKHYFNTFAVKDRINLSMYSSFPVCTEPTPDVLEILPSAADECSLKSNFTVMVARILVDNIQIFKIFDDVLDRHIGHTYSGEMSTKSEIVSHYLYIVN